MTMNNQSSRSRSKSPRAALKVALAVFICLGGATGCQSGPDLFGLRKREDERVRQMANADDVRGPLQRFLESGSFRKEKPMQYTVPREAQQQYDLAEAKFKRGDFKAAEGEFGKVAKKYKDTPIREDALFMEGECRYRRKRYSWAEESYDKVVKEFPSTRYLDTVSQRKFDIARTWLGFPEIVTSSDVSPVNFEDPGSTPPPQSSRPAPSGLTYTVPILPNLVDRTRPVFDTKGRALNALRSIWLNDPTGPLADDALMLTASHHLREQDYLEADRVYTMLRNEYPKSRHLENAYVLGAYVKQMSYQGSAYDGTALEGSRELRESALRLYPNNPDRERMLDDIHKIEEARAARDWEIVQFYQKKNKPRSVAIAAKELIKNHPNSKYATQAREVLARIPAADKQNVIPNPYESKAPSGNESAPAGRTKISDDEAPGEFSPDSDAGEIGNPPSGEDPFSQ